MSGGGLARRAHLRKAGVRDSNLLDKVCGGPMFYGQQIGLNRVVKPIKTFGETLGADFWTAASLLEQLAEEGAGSMLPTAAARAPDGPKRRRAASQRAL